MFALLISHPEWLWGLLLIAIPPAIHLLLRQKLRTEPWAAMRFLQRALVRQQRQVRLKRWLQLFARMALIGCLVLAVAQPRNESSRNAPRGEHPVHRLLILDVSLSMRARSSGVSSFERLQSVTAKLLDRSRPGDAWQVLRNGDPDNPIVIGEPSRNAEAVQLEINSLQPGWQPGNLTETFRLAVEQLANGGERDHLEVWLLTDLQRSEWEEQGAPSTELRNYCRQLSRLSRLVVVDCGNPEVENWAITELSEQQSARDPTAGNLAVKFLHSGSGANAPQLDVSVDLRSGFRKQVPLENERRTTLNVQVALEATRPHLIEGIISQDALLEDNRRWLHTEPERPLSVLIVDGLAEKPPDEADYLSLALNPEFRLSQRSESTNAAGGFAVERISESQLDAMQFEDFAVVILNDVASYSPPEIEKLKRYVERGGGVLLIAGRNFSPDSFNAQFGESGAGLSPARIRDMSPALAEGAAPFSFVPREADHPVLVPFRNHPAAGMAASTVHRYWRADALEQGSASERVIDLSNGDPLLMFHHHGAGRVGLFTTSVDEKWGTWILSPAFVPILQETLKFLSAQRHLVSQSILTQPVELPVAAGPYQWTSERQDGKLAQGTADSGHFTPTSEPFSEPGVYQVRSSALLNGQHTVVRNVDSADSSFERISAKELRSQIFPRLRVELTNPQLAGLQSLGNAPGSAEEARISRWLVMLAFGLALFDVMLGHSRGRVAATRPA